MRKYDIDLDRRDLQQLSDANEITAFFARLGYSTDAQIEQTAQNLSITSEVAKRQIKHIRLVADEGAFLQVYLFELKSVTMTGIRELARAFRNKAGNYLFVFTSEYNRLDFVLIERFTPIGTSNRIGTKHSGVRPRILTLDRITPDTIAIRVLRRFTYTESDPFYQYEKLLSAYSIADWSEEYFNNRALFSDYYLMNRLHSKPEWSKDPKPAYKGLKSIYKESLSKYLSEREVKIRSELYEPTFKELGFKYKTGKAATDPAHKRPDYYLYSAEQNPNTDKPLAVALVYPWGRSLDGKDDQRDRDTSDENPGAAVVSLLEAEQAPWAIVTNGQTWRLYSQKTHSRATNYYEIDLTEALSLGSPVHVDPALAFRYYWLFYRCDAFEKKRIVHEGKEVDYSFLDQIVAGSEEYAKELGERLKERIFERIFPHLSEGFIVYIRATEGKEASISQERLDRIFQGTLTLLYRLLFLLYAESRDLLPAKEVRGYYEAGIKKLKEEIADVAGNIEDQAPAKIAKRYRADEYEINKRLSQLFKVIDHGSEKLNVPIYNGGLFVTALVDDDDAAEADNARFLRDFAVPDRYIAQSIDLIARDIDDKRQDLVFIDYKSLGVRHLGSMYEGLLEFRLRIAPQKMAIVKGKKTEEIIPYKEAKSKKHKILTEGRGKNAKERIIPKGAVYLENDKRERKATGSYYTPGHIVNYIVEHAVGPVLKEKLETLRPKLRDVEKRRKAFDERQKALQHSGLKPEPEQKKKLIGRDLVNEVFNIRVLDPAMGSGHFLVQAVDFITDKMLDFLNAFPINPVRDFLEITRNTILKEIEGQGITIDPARLTDVNLLKRHVLKRCIYGVDLNPMAVELAKVSLWLDCFTLGAPLSFLDHHLRCGNSLISVTVEEVREAIEEKQIKIFGSNFTGLMLATDLMRQVGELPDVTSEDVSESRRKYKKAADSLAPFKRILDVYTSRWFGNEPPSKGRKKSGYDPAKEFLQSQEADSWLKDPEGAKLAGWARDIADTAVEASAEKHFFHWELEFPEVFYGPRPGTERVIERLEGSGFDAVVGNPPYDVLAEKEIGYDITNELEYFKGYLVFEPAIKGKNNLYKLFICRGFSVTKTRGYFSFIVPMALLGDEQSAGVRQLMLTKSDIQKIEVFPQKDDPLRRVFTEAKLATTIFLTKRRPPEIRFKLRSHPNNTVENDSLSLSLSSNEIVAFDSINAVIPSCSQKDWEIATKVLLNSNVIKMSDYAESFQGEVNETNERKRGALRNDTYGDLILRGSNVCMYIIREASQGEDIYLDRAEFLAGKGQNTKAYDYQYDRVGFQRSSPQNNFRRLIAAYLPKENFCFDTISYVTEKTSKIDLNLLLILLNSKFLDWYFRLGSTNSKVNEYQFKNLPVPSIEKTDEKTDLPINWIEYINQGKWEELKETIQTAINIPGILPSTVCNILISLCKKVQEVESKRLMKSRSERSRLDERSQKIQNIIDSTLSKTYGLSENEASYIEKRLTEML